jgi:arginyl-tRNA synthetase
MKTIELLNLIKTKTEEKIQQLYPSIKLSLTINMPTDRDKADLVINSAFAIGKAVGMAPVDVATEICNEVNKDSVLTKYIDFSASHPGFINIIFQDKLLSLILDEVTTLGDGYGENNLLKDQTWVIEHTSPNPNKSMHLGHLRNNIIGMAIARLCEFSGAKVIYDAVDNNRGIAIAKAMWGFLVNKRRDGKRIEDISYWYEHQDEWVRPDEVLQKADHFIGDCYLLGSEEFKSNKETDNIIRTLVLSWEQGDRIVWALWEKVLNYSYAGIQETLTRLGNRWDNIWHEHEHYKDGKELVIKGLKKGVFRKLENGAVLTNLEGYSLPDTIVLKSDGTSLYITQDIALTKLKKDRFKANKLIWVIGPEQSLAMRQLFAVCEQLGIGKLNEFDHVSYGLVNIQTASGSIKKMSSRGGEVLLIDELIDEVKKTLINSGREYSDNAAEDIAIDAIKLAVLKPSRSSNVTINIKNALNLEGDSGVYLLYTYARMKSLLSKTKTNKVHTFSLNESERTIVSSLLYFPMIVENSTRDYFPNFIVDYLFELAHLFNTLYAGERFITDNKDETNKKMLITASILVVFSNAFKLLGIKPIDKI